MTTTTVPKANPSVKIPVEKNWSGKVIRTPNGLAREYASLACTLFTGCPHVCSYCFVPETPPCKFKGVSREAFHDAKRVAVRPGIQTKLLGDLNGKFMQEHRKTELLFSFGCDPFPKGREDLHVYAILAARFCIEAGQRFTVLTKNPRAAMRILELNPPRGLFRLGCTITTFLSKQIAKREPYAPNIAERMAAIDDCYRQGVPTWISAEPTTPNDAMRIVERFGGICEEIKIGRLNHDKDAPDYDWRPICTHWERQGMEQCGTKITVKDGTWMHAGTKGAK